MLSNCAAQSSPRSCVSARSSADGPGGGSLSRSSVRSSSIDLRLSPLDVTSMRCELTAALVGGVRPLAHKQHVAGGEELRHANALHRHLRLRATAPHFEVLLVLLLVLLRPVDRVLVHVDRDVVKRLLVRHGTRGRCGCNLFAGGGAASRDHTQHTLSTHL